MEPQREYVLRQGQTVAEVYEVVSPLGRGGSGEVYRVAHPTHGANRVIKLFIPYFYVDQMTLPGVLPVEDAPTITDQLLSVTHKMFHSKNEYMYLASVDHPFIVKAHEYGQQILDNVSVDQLERNFRERITRNRPLRIPYIVSSFVEGTRFTAELARSLSRRRVITALTGVASALDYLHQKHQLLHCDIKSRNVLVRPDGYAVLVDFALSLDLKPTSSDSEQKIFGSIDSSLAPSPENAKEIKKLLTDLPRSGVDREELRRHIFPWLDQYQFGCLIRDLLPGISHVLSAPECSYLREVTGNLTSWEWLQSQGDLQLEEMVRRVDSSRTYSVVKAGAAEGDLRLPSPIRRINVPAALSPVVLHPAVVRLNRLNQLGLLPARFPGATHTRFLHSLDCFRLTRSLARRLLDRPGFRFRFSEQDVRALLVCGLLHDINHIPLMHVYQESEIDLLAGIDLYDVNCNAQHDVGGSLSQTLDDQGLPYPRFKRIVGEPWEKQGGSHVEVDKTISSIISSGLDVDKLSYLQLDSLFSGRGFAPAIDIDRLFEAADVVMYEPDPTDEEEASVHPGFHIAFDEAVTPLLETVVAARLRAFKELYWCAENRAMMASLLDVLRRVHARRRPGATGADDLRRLILETTGLPDYSVLLKIDSIAAKFSVETVKLASFYETIADQITLVLETTRPTDYLRGLSSEKRVEFDSRLRDEVVDRLRVGDDAHLFVDVPRRQLDLGGRLLTITNERVALLKNRSDAVVAYERELGILSRRTRVFCSARVLSALEDQVGPPSQARVWMRDLVMSILKEGTFK